MRWPEIALRASLSAGSALAVNLHASVWVSAPLGLVAIAATIELAIRPYGRGSLDRVLLGCGCAVVALILLGIGLNLTPWGLTRAVWTVTWLVLGIGVLYWRRSARSGVTLAHVRVPLSAFWAVPVVGMLVAAGFVAQAGVRAGTRPVLALSLQSKTAREVTVQINATLITGSYRIVAQSGAPGARPYASHAFRIDAGAGSARIVRHVPTNVPSRWTITLSSVTGAQARELIVDVGSNPTSWVDVWQADFAGAAYSQPSAADWVYDTGSGFGDGEVETMTTSRQNAHLDGDGDLVITPLRQNGSWTSARLQSKQTFLFAPGSEYQVSASIMQPDPVNGIGYWPAFWMLSPGSPTNTGEIDVLEDINGYDEHSATFHCGYDRQSSDLCISYGVGSGLQACPGCQLSYHTYTAIVNRLNPGAEEISWYLDGREFYSIDESQIGDSLWNSVLSRPFSIILEVGIGGVYPNSRCGCTSPLSQTSPGASMRVQYVTVAKLAP